MQVSVRFNLDYSLIIGLIPCYICFSYICFILHLFIAANVIKLHSVKSLELHYTDKQHVFTE